MGEEQQTEGVLKEPGIIIIKSEKGKESSVNSQEWLLCYVLVIILLL